MTALLFQTLLLMVPAFFIGAALACGLRKLIQPAERAVVVPAAIPTAARVAPGPVEPLPQYAARETPRAAPAVEAAKPAPVVQPVVQPAITRAETPRPAAPQPVTTPAPTAAAVNRFDEALSGRGPATPAVTPAPAPAGVPAAAKVVEPAMRPAAPPPPAAPPVTPAAAPVAKPAAPPPAVAAPAAVAPAAAAPVAVAPVSPPAVSALTIASAAAAAAAAAAAVAQQARAATRVETPVAAPTAPVEAPPQHRLPTAAPEPTVLPAPVKPAVAPVEVGDDLTRISGIDEGISEKLKKLGVTRYSHIAKWYQTDVASISRSLGYDGRIERENWIEQAQILANGGETYYSGRRARTAAPAPADGTPPSAASPSKVAAAIPSAPSSAPSSAIPSAVIAAAAAAAAAASAPRVAERAAFSTAAATASVTPSAVTPPAPPASAPSVVTAAVAAAAAAAPLQMKPEAAAAPPPPTATPVRPTMAPTRDVLQRIGGINAEIERLLAAQGVTRYTQIAGWGTGDLERFDRLLGSQGRISRENWIEQAQILSKGGDTVHSREFDRRNSEVPRDAVARPKSIAEAIRNNAAAAVPTVTSAAAKPDIGGLRSVRSEAYRPLSDATTTASAAAAAASGSAKVVRSAEMDDLKRIRGVGVLIEKRLNSVGIVSYDQIADWTTDDIDRISASLDFKGRIERENWVEQARILAAGGQTEFSRRVDRGEVETSKPKPS